MPAPIAPWQASTLLQGAVLLDSIGELLVFDAGIPVYNAGDTGPDYPPVTPVTGNAGAVLLSTSGELLVLLGDYGLPVYNPSDSVLFDPYSTIISQYANSPILTSIITSFAAAMDQTSNFQSFYDNIWNISSARGAGLDIWGRIVGVKRTIHVSHAKWFGFYQQRPGIGGWYTGGSPFYSGQSLTSSYDLTDDAFRLLIMAKAAYNISDCSIPSINKLLRSLFPGRGNAYVTEGHMSMTYTFTFPLTSVELAIVGQSGVLPQQAGVAATIIVPA